MNRDQSLGAAKTQTGKIDANAKSKGASVGAELSDEQIASISGGGDFPTNGGSGDTSINGNPINPNIPPPPTP